MRLIIAKDGIKREVEGPFELCIMPREAELLVETLKAKLDRDNWGGGWIYVADPPPHQCPPNTPPMKWTDR